MKKWMWLLAVLMLTIGLAGCDPAEEVAPEDEGAVAVEAGDSAESTMDDAEPFRVAAVMPSATNDLAFSQSIFDALTAIQNEMGADNFEFVFADGLFVVDDAAAAIRDWAGQGFDLIVAHGSQYGASLEEIAPDFPDVSFAWGTAGDTFGLPNVYAYEANSQEGGYVNGVMAALLNESGTIGVVGPVEVGDAKLYVDGFIAGVTATNPDIVVNTNYIGSFSDVALATEAANTHIGAGADSMTGTAQMVIGPIGVAQENNVPWFGTQSNQSELAPTTVVASQVYKWDVVLNDIIANVKNGQLGGEAYVINLANGGEVVEFNDAFGLPDGVRESAESVIQGIISGAIDPLSSDPIDLDMMADGEEMASEEAMASPLADLGPYRVAVVMPSATNDLAFSQSMFDALTVIQNEMGADNFEFVFADGAFVVDDAASAIRDWASQEYDLIIAHGSQYGASLEEIAPDFPDVSFAWGTAGDTFGLPNVYAYEANSQEGGYVNGVLAALLNESGTIGVVGPIEVGDAKLYVDGFIAGVAATNPDIVVNVNYIGSFSDVALGTEAANTHIGAGADSLTGTAQMVVGPIGVAQQNGVAWFGTQSNQSELAPSIVVASQVYKWEVVLREILTNISQGVLGGEAYVITLANGGLVMEYNDSFALPDDVRAAGDAAIEGIIDGSITIDLGE